MIWENIAVQLDSVFAEMQKLQRDSDDMPAASEVREVTGATYGIAGIYADALKNTMRYSATVRDEMLHKLEEMQGAVAAALEAIATQDEESKQAAEALLEAVEGAPASDSGPTPPPPAAAAAAAPKTGGLLS